MNTFAELTHSSPGVAHGIALRLSRLLGSDSEPAQLVPLEQELARTRDYLEVEAVRFGARLAAEFDIAACVQQLAVPPYAVQTLTENAVRHGVDRSTRPVQICVRAWRDADRLNIEVWDDGPGPLALGTSAGTGLKNLRERLALIYDSDPILSLVRKGHRTRAKFVVPAR